MNIFNTGSFLVNIGKGNVTIGGKDICGNNNSNKQIQGSGKIIQVKRELNNFEKITIAAPINVEVNHGNEQSVNIEGDDNIVPLLNTRVEQNTLYVDFSENTSLNFKKLTLKIHIPAINALLVVGSGTINANNFSEKKLNNEIKGTGTIHLSNFTTEVMTIVVNGSGSIEASGKTKHLHVTIAGSGEVDTLNLQSQQVSVDIAGSGEAFVHSDGKLDAQIVGSGEIRYRGLAQVHKNVIGTGIVKLQK